MFRIIAETLQSRPSISRQGLADSEVYRRLWRLLGAFEFVGGKSRESITEEIDQLLMAVVDRTDLLPQTRAAVDEERRLCYVGVTRAQRRLTLTLALSRRKWGKARPTNCSRFLYELTGKADNPNYLKTLKGRGKPRRKIRS
jgi:superfamily I DNA/RNA helicase